MFDNKIKILPQSIFHIFFITIFYIYFLNTKSKIITDFFLFIAVFQ